ncbi:hypothetical protein HDU79_010789 [Rhizoclosmatium sp. JEL0117]|nr:hypothetical protein HDU79_010789 [Rhizoclosmatium sp. JEL0117]
MNNVPPLPPVPVSVQTQVDEYGFHVPIKKEVRGSVASDFASSPSSKAKSTVADSNSSLAGITRSKSLRYSLKGLPRSDTGEGSMGFGRKLSRALSLKISNSNGSISPAGPVIPIDPAIIEKEKTWLRVLDAGDLKNPQNIKQVKKLCREGIPGSLRGRVWIALTQQKHLRDHELYQSLMEKQKAMDTIEIFDVIERDVARCYPQHVMFIDKDGDGINNLRNILRTYALYNPVLGYTQGMGFIVGMLLMHIPNPEDAFWVLVSMLEGVCKGFYESDLKRVRMDAKVFDMLVKNMDPRLAKYFEANQIDGLISEDMGHVSV